MEKLARIIDSLVVWIQEVRRLDVVVDLQSVARLESEQHETGLAKVFDSVHFFFGELDFLFGEGDEVADVFVVQLGIVLNAHVLVHRLHDLVVLRVQVDARSHLDLVDQRVAKLLFAYNYTPTIVPSPILKSTLPSLLFLNSRRRMRADKSYSRSPPAII